MKRILLVCSGGMSTSILVNKMKEEAAIREIECVIEARGNSNLEELKGKWDCCLVGPQIRFAMQKIKEDLEVPTEVIEMQTYGMANGKKALDQALELLK
jgi:PTS system cellobiose-specific IIB component